MLLSVFLSVHLACAPSLSWMGSRFLPSFLRDCTFCIDYQIIMIPTESNTRDANPARIGQTVGWSQRILPGPSVGLRARGGNPPWTWLPATWCFAEYKHPDRSFTRIRHMPPALRQPAGIYRYQERWPVPVCTRRSTALPTLSRAPTMMAADSMHANG